MNNNQLDAIDHKILQLLQEDARLDVMEIVRRVNLTKTPVASRICRLKENGFIQSYRAVINRVKIGPPVLVIAHIKLEKQSTELLDCFELR